MLYFPLNFFSVISTTTTTILTHDFNYHNYYNVWNMHLSPPQSLMENVILIVATATAKTISDDNCDHI